MRITAATQTYALLGQPVGHSLSPILQNYWIQQGGFDAVYVALAVAEAEFETALAGLFHAGLAGANVTIPFKERAAHALQNLTDQARDIGSVNCMMRTESGYCGDSTDGDGLVADLEARAPGWRDIDGHIVLLGAGGAARSILYSLHKAGVPKIILVNRNTERAWSTAQVVHNIGVEVRAWVDLADCLHSAGIVINATSAGLNHQHPLDIDFSNTHPDCVGYDSVYAPRTTLFLQNAQKANRLALDGLGMLVGQGALSFRHWFGVMPDQHMGMEVLNRALLEKGSKS